MKLFIQVGLLAVLALCLPVSSANAALTYSSASQSGLPAFNLGVGLQVPLSDSTSVDINGNVITYTLDPAASSFTFSYTDSAGANRASYTASSLSIVGIKTGAVIPASTFAVGNYLVDDIENIYLVYNFTDRFGIAKTYHYSSSVPGPFYYSALNLNLPFTKGVTKVSPSKLTVVFTGSIF